jgi:hypothetical protein
MSPPTEQLIRDYLNRLSVAARGRLTAEDRRALVTLTHDFIERNASESGPPTAMDVAALLSRLGDPGALVEQEAARLAESRGEVTALTDADRPGRLHGMLRRRSVPASWHWPAAPGSPEVQRELLAEASARPGTNGTAQDGHADPLALRVPRQPDPQEREVPPDPPPPPGAPVAGEPATGRPVWPSAALRAGSSRPASSEAASSEAASSEAASSEAASSEAASSEPASSEQASSEAASSEAASSEPASSEAASSEAASSEPGGSGPETAEETAAALTEPAEGPDPADADAGLTGLAALGLAGPDPAGRPADPDLAASGGTDEQPGRAWPGLARAWLTDLGSRALAGSRRTPMEATASILLGLGGVIYPPVWLLGACLAVASKVWDYRDKWAGLAGALAIMIIGTATCLALGSGQSGFGSYLHAAWVYLNIWSRVGAAAGTWYLVWRLAHQRETPDVPPWARPRRVD